MRRSWPTFTVKEGHIDLSVPENLQLSQTPLPKKYKVLAQEL